MMGAYPLRLNADMAWLLRGRIRPGVSVVGCSGVPDAARHIDRVARDLRYKVNASILRFVDEPDLNRSDFVTIGIDIDQAWMIDAVVDFDGNGGLGAEILLQTTRIIWAHDMDLPVTLVDDDPHVLSTTDPPSSEHSQPFDGVWKILQQTDPPNSITA